MRAHCVLTVDTAALLKRYAEAITLSAINSGSVLFNPPTRGSDTFLPLRKYPYDMWLKRRPKRDAVVEVAVDYAVKDVDELVVRVARMKQAEIVEVLLDRR
jgi:hypothetical protein